MLVVGSLSGKVKALLGFRHRELDRAGPVPGSTSPTNKEVLGGSGFLPSALFLFAQVNRDWCSARRFVGGRQHPHFHYQALMPH